jgi:hypothetical protein
MGIKLLPSARWKSSVTVIHRTSTGINNIVLQVDRMNTECLDTLRQLLMHMKENTDSESSCEEAQTSEEAGRLPSFRSSSSSSEAEVPLEAIPLALRSSNHLEVAAVAALRH